MRRVATEPVASSPLITSVASDSAVAVSCSGDAGAGRPRRRARGTSTIPEMGGMTAKKSTSIGMGAMRPDATSRSMLGIMVCRVGAM
ncbi:hypothetical protein GCM10022420_043710 [Streptomyces iranensis]